MPRAQTARSSWDRRRPRSAATWHPIGELLPPPSPWPSCGGRVQRGQCADWNTAGAPPSRYTARHVADSAAHRGSRAGSACRTKRRSSRMGRPRRPETGKGIGDGESPAKEEKWWGRAQNGVLLLNLGFFFMRGYILRSFFFLTTLHSCFVFR
jgi:hypothetical protein